MYVCIFQDHASDAYGRKMDNMLWQGIQEHYSAALEIYFVKPKHVTATDGFRVDQSSSGKKKNV